MPDEYHLNVCGLGAPEPVYRLKKLLDAIPNGTVRITANSSFTADHLVRFAKKEGYKASSEEKGDEFYITVIKEKEFEFPIGVGNASMPYIMLIKDNALGKHNGLGEQIIQGLIKKLTVIPNKPLKIIFMNEGVFLTTKDEYQGVQEDLKVLETKGVEILSCFTCLEFFKLTQSVKVGKIGNALDILNDLTQSPSLVI